MLGTHPPDEALLPLRKEGEGKQHNWKGEIRAGNRKKGQQKTKAPRGGGRRKPRGRPPAGLPLTATKWRTTEPMGFGCRQRSRALLAFGERQASFDACPASPSSSRVEHLASRSRMDDLHSRRGVF